MPNTIGANKIRLKDGVYYDFSISDKKTHPISLLFIINNKKYFEIDDEIIAKELKYAQKDEKKLIKKSYSKIQIFLKDHSLEGEEVSEINFNAMRKDKNSQVKLLQEFIINIFDQWINYIASTKEFKDFVYLNITTSSFQFSDDVHRNFRQTAREKITIDYCAKLLLRLKTANHSKLCELYTGKLESRFEDINNIYKNVEFVPFTKNIRESYNFNDLKMALIDSIIYEESNQTEKIIETLINDIFESGYNTLTFPKKGESIKDKTKEIFKKYFLNEANDLDIKFDLIKEIMGIAEVEVPIFYVHEKYEEIPPNSDSIILSTDPELSFGDYSKKTSFN